MRVDTVAFLACGWSLASTKTHATAIALDTDQGVILADAGGDATRGLVATFGTDRLDHVYLTHEHPDHTYALPGLVHHLRFAGARDRLVVHGPAPALGRARGALEALGVTCPFSLEWDPLEEAAGGDARADWVPADHSVPTLAYRFGDVVICGDTGPSELIVELARGASLLVHEASHTNEKLTHTAGHSTPEDAAKVASRADVGTLALIHIHPDLGLEGALEGCPFEDTLAPVDGDIVERAGDTWQERGR